jgi:acyl carrier protein
VNSNEIAGWLASHIAELTGASPGSVSWDVPFESFGLDSATAVAITADLEDLLGVEIDPSAAYDHPNIRELAGHLATVPVIGAVRRS